MRLSRLGLILAVLILLPVFSRAQIIETDAEFAVIMDHETGEILWSKNGDTPMIPASMTKMMTAYFTFDLIEQGEITLDPQMAAGWISIWYIDDGAEPARASNCARAVAGQDCDVRQ